ncbi:MAG: DMT family transporter [Proteobacteria bacterium]|nr:DMT family transporter [Pseudomonadota bacterium]MBU1581598.1 DMT family transporter [Pseudomonadota bacterium]MBU2452248.1 DMT family transporter [Pseudomonadota bacterium]MBU2628155.1 DMT family transporter [Pseudomonadota bacterium]
MLGAILSLCAAFLWASAVILFKKSGEVFSPVSLNLYKSIVALILVSLTMLMFNIPFFPDKPVNDWLLLAVSGFIGITLADLFFFMALNRLGAGIVAIVECLYLPSVIFFSFILLGESLSINAIIGGLLVLAAVFVGSIKKKRALNAPPEVKTSLSGIFIGCLSMIFVAAGIVLIKELLDRTDVLWATLVRVVAAIVSLLILVLCHPKRKLYFNELKFSKAWFIALPASIAGNYLALLCWMGGMKYTTASRAAILNQMSTIFIFILAAVFLKEKITVNKSIAILLALTGAFLTILG